MDGKTKELPGVLILYNSPRDLGSGVYRGGESDAGVLAEKQAVSEALAGTGAVHRAKGIGGLEELPGILAESVEPVVFNLVEELPGGPDASSNHVPAVCRAFGKAVTGCDTSCQLLAQDKWRTSAVLKAAGVPVPAGKMVPVGSVFSPVGAMHGPFIVKPCARDASEGIGETSVFPEEGPSLHEAVRQIHEHFNQAALVEQYVGVREFNISIFQQAGEVRILPIAEIDFSTFEPGRARIVDYAAKWQGDSFQYKNTRRVIPAPVGEALAARIREVSLAAWRAIDCRDYARVDIRADNDGKIFVLEVNPNPDISPDAGFSAALAAAGVRFEEFVETMVTNAFRRRVPGSSGSACKMPVEDIAGGAIIRRIKASDRDGILHFVEETGLFRAGEVAIAHEVLEESIVKGPAGHYQSFVAELNSKATGWVCFGPTPCTVGTFDIYWLVVDPRHQGRGLGKALMEYAERLIVEKGGRIAVVETSGHSRYQPTRAFYSRAGYIEQARIVDFYAPGDDKIIFIKRLR